MTGPVNDSWPTTPLAFLAATLGALNATERIYRVLELGSGDGVAPRLLSPWVGGASWTLWDAGQHVSPGPHAAYGRVLRDPEPRVADCGLFDVLLSLGPADPFDTARFRDTIDAGLRVSRCVLVMLPTGRWWRSAGLQSHALSVFRRDVVRIALSISLETESDHPCGLFLMAAERDTRNVYENVGREVIAALPVAMAQSGVPVRLRFRTDAEVAATRDLLRRMTGALNQTP